MTKTMGTTSVPGSFRDPSGYLFRHDGNIYRQVNESYRNDYELMMSSGFYLDPVRGLLA